MTLSSSCDHYVLAGDIGGTKTNLGLFTRGKRRPLLKFHETYPSRQYSSLESIIALFLAKYPVNIKSACFGMPGPIHNGAVRVTNLTWKTSESRIRGRFKFKKVRLINDLTATSLAIPFLNKKELHTLNKGSRQKDGNLAILAPGTGIGETLVVCESGSFIPVPSEGGHVDFAPNNEKEVELLRYLKKKYGHVSLERILTGPGLADIYAFLTSRRKDKDDRRILIEIKKADPAMIISQAAIKGEAKSCKAALDMFVSILGAAAGNLALVGMTKGGVYLGGGIPPKILPKLKDGAFISSFTDKGRFKGLLEKIPVHVILNDTAALLGAASKAFEASDTIMKGDL
jgi:glucokinase